MLMRRRTLAILGMCVLAAGGTAVARAGDEPSHKKEIEQLNRLTGLDPTQGMLQELLDNPKKAKALIGAALPLARKKVGLNYNAALVLAFAAAEQKDMKACDAFFHVCADIAAKQQSPIKLAQSYGTLIEFQFEFRNYDACIRVCREVLELKTDDGKPREVYRAFTEDATGETDFDRDDGFHSTRPMKRVVQQYLAKSLAKKGDFDDALKVAETLIRDEADWTGIEVKGYVLYEAEQYDKAATAYRDVIAILQRETGLPAARRDRLIDNVRAILSQVYVDAKKIEQAAEQLEMLVKRKPDEPRFYNDLGYILADHDMRLDEAEKLIRKALELDLAIRKKSPNYDPKTDHDHGAYLDSLGWVLFKKKQYAEARKYLEMALEDKDAQHIEIYDHLGDVCLALGDRKAAIQAWQKGLDFVREDRRDQKIRAAVEKKLDDVKTKSASK
jgi:tetratricopeptide (TPR) repeat protein